MQPVLIPLRLTVAYKIDGLHFCILPYAGDLHETGDAFLLFRACGDVLITTDTQNNDAYERFVDIDTALRLLQHGRCDNFWCRGIFFHRDSTSEKLGIGVAVRQRGSRINSPEMFGTRA